MATDITSTIKLPSGFEIPRLGFGIDSAAIYKNEAGCGNAIRASQIPREQIFFTSKVINISYDGAKAQIDESLALSKLDYIDLMLLHQPRGGSENRKGAWLAVRSPPALFQSSFISPLTNHRSAIQLVEAVEAGKIRSIGVSNYGVHHLNELEAYISTLEKERGKGRGGIISINQVELHPWLARKDIVDWCTARGIFLEAYCPIVRGARFNEPNLQKLAEKYGKTPAQVLIRWSLDKGFIPLPKSVTPGRIVDNADVFGFSLTGDEVRALETDEYSPVAWDPTVTGLDE
ncbi:oxidoreductase [Penicillium manginii]|uniref:oxidoreductase n=1 Tax=Penicillium manginii TaxID=203109 RepID=UPI00254744A4|nr:oxidoreductase [Penicillium manginii]KAJ5741402.1 oxidoreductase [Penicillium manginii]